MNCTHCNFPLTNMAHQGSADNCPHKSKGGPFRDAQKPITRPEEVDPVPSPAEPEKASERGTQRHPTPWPKSEWEKEVIGCPDIPPSKMAALWSVARFADWGTGKDSKQRQTILAAAAKKTPRAIRKDLDWCREAGWLYRYATERGEGKPDIYWLTVPSCGHGHSFDDLWDRSEDLSQSNH